MSPGEACEKPDVSGSEHVGGSVFCWEKGHYDISASEEDGNAVGHLHKSEAKYR